MCFFGVKCKTQAKHRYLHEFLGPTLKKYAYLQCLLKKARNA